MIQTPEIAERRETLIKDIVSFFTTPRSEPESSSAWKILKLRVDLLIAEVEHAARIDQIEKDYRSMKERLK
jgi:hypothetical protein